MGMSRHETKKTFEQPFKQLQKAKEICRVGAANSAGVENRRHTKYENERLHLKLWRRWECA